MKRSFFIVFLFSFGLVLQAQILQDQNYKSIKIGSQVWMTENLDVTTYRNGDSIPQVQDPKMWSGLRTGAWCYYENKTDNGTKYGKLYNWYAVVDPRGLAPEGWHIPSDEEWTTLATTVGGRFGSSAKIKSPKGWAKDGNGTNETGFTALPGGTRSVELFSFANNYGYWWSSSEFDSYSAWNRFLSYNNNDIGRSTGWKQFGNSVRCVKGDASNIVLKNTLPLDSKKENLATVVDQSKSIVDIQNSDIKKVNMGDQTWTSENLNVITFQNGDTIFHAKTDSEWRKAGELNRPAWCYYNNDPANEKKYGKLYNWYAINDKRGLAPNGWHVAVATEWTKLINSIGGEKIAGTQIKTPASFLGLLAGFRSGDGEFHNVGIAGYWWGSTESSPTNAWCFSINYYSSACNSDNSGDKQKGFSVRCVKD